MAAKFGTKPGEGEPVPNLPVYFKQSDVIDTGFLSVYEVCIAAEKIAGINLIDGSQIIRGLWRIYFSDKSDERTRIQLLATGITLRGQHVNLYDRNPFLTRNNREATKVMIGGIPLSVSNEQIYADFEAVCKQRNSTVIGQIRNELARDDNGKLTRFKTGRRFLYMDPNPSNPIPKQLPLAGFTASIRYKEQNESVLCNICNQIGHSPNQCKLCFDCFETGHKRGDPRCNHIPNQQRIDFERSGILNNDEARSAGSGPSTAGEVQHRAALADPPGGASSVWSDGDEYPAADNDDTTTNKVFEKRVTRKSEADTDENPAIANDDENRETNSKTTTNKRQLRSDNSRKSARHRKRGRQRGKSDNTNAPYGTDSSEFEH